MDNFRGRASYKPHPSDYKRMRSACIVLVLHDSYMHAMAIEFESMVRGYHIYKDVWDAVIGQTLPCQMKSRNASDPYAVAVICDSWPCPSCHICISAVCNLFLRRGGTTTCRVTGANRYSADLVQGGLEIPCKLVFTGDDKDIAKVQELLKVAPSSGSALQSFLLVIEIVCAETL